MGNFKSGSGDLDFGSSSDDDAGRSEGQDEAPGNTEASQPASEADTDETTDTEASPEGEEEYPYFVRRNKVLDGRTERLEFHVREHVADQESAFRSAVADELDTGSVSKTDVREFALLVAYQHPEEVAALMEEEGYGMFD